jgi:hypothetical protein
LTEVRTDRPSRDRPTQRTSDGVAGLSKVAVDVGQQTCPLALPASGPPRDVSTTLMPQPRQTAGAHSPQRQRATGRTTLREKSVGPRPDSLGGGAPEAIFYFYSSSCFHEVRVALLQGIASTSPRLTWAGPLPSRLPVPCFRGERGAPSRITAAVELDVGRGKRTTVRHAWRRFEKVLGGQPPWQAVSNPA